MQYNINVLYNAIKSLGYGIDNIFGFASARLLSSSDILFSDSKVLSTEDIGAGFAVSPDFLNDYAIDIQPKTSSEYTTDINIIPSQSNPYGLLGYLEGDFYYTEEQFGTKYIDNLSQCLEAYNICRYRIAQPLGMWDDYEIERTTVTIDNEAGTTNTVVDVYTQAFITEGYSYSNNLKASTGDVLNSVEKTYRYRINKTVDFDQFIDFNKTVFEYLYIEIDGFDIIQYQDQMYDDSVLDITSEVDYIDGINYYSKVRTDTPIANIVKQQVITSIRRVAGLRSFTKDEIVALYNS